MKETIIFGILIFFLIFFSCGKKEENGYPIKIKKVDNVIYIDNPGYPKNLTKEFNLKEELSIGNETDDNYLFLKVRKLFVDDQGNIFVLDSGRCLVQIFDENGRYIRSIGRKGKGPGEFLRPYDLIVDIKKIIHILDGKNRKISCYHLNGTFISDLRLKDGSPSSFFLDPKGFYFVKYSITGNTGEEKNKIVKYTLNGNRLLQSKEFLESKREIYRKGGFVLTFKAHFDLKGYFAYDQKESFYYGSSDRYEIILFNTNFEKLKIIRKRDHKRIKVTREEIKDVKEGFKENLKRRGIFFDFGTLKFPEYREIFSGIWLDDRNRILINTTTKEDKAHIDIYNSEGIYLEKMVINKPPEEIPLAWVFYCPVFKDGFIYSVVRNKEEALLVKKYMLLEKKK